MRITESTESLLRAHKQITSLNLERLFASGIDIKLSRYGDEDDDRPHLDRITLAAEDCGPLRLVLIEAIEKQLETRRDTLARSLRAVAEILDAR